MDSNDAAAIRKETRIYVAVFAALAVLTLVTVGVARLDFLHQRPALGIAVALLIATVKGGLVAAYFMHLISERKAIYAILLLTLFFFAVLMASPSLEHLDQRGNMP
jgi:cytochrome c oxidase subunit 4